MVRWWLLCIDLVFAVVRLLFGWFWIGSECLLLCGVVVVSGLGD